VYLVAFCFVLGFFFVCVCVGFFFKALTTLFILVKQDLSQCVTCQEKHITVKKEPHESLGMTVAGGRGSKSGELPIFVTSVQPHGCLARDGRIKRGRAWLSWWHGWPPVVFWWVHSLKSRGVIKPVNKCNKAMMDVWLCVSIMEIEYLVSHFHLF